MRQDLLALTSEDLELYSNRGTVRRATAEIESGEPALANLQEDDAGLIFTWSDAAICKFASQEDLKKSTCSCSSTTTCRHIIRSVLYFQRCQAPPPAADSADSPRPDNTTKNQEHQNLKEEPLDVSGSKLPWWPGDISDDLLARSTKNANLKTAQALFNAGQIVRVSGGVKPKAHFLSLSHTVRFLVAGDVRYAVCDCSDESPCAHAILAVKSFRLVAPKESPQLVTTAAYKEPPAPWLKEIELAAGNLLAHGLNSSNKEFLRQINQFKDRCDEAGYFFISELLSEILEYRESYLISDASVSPENLASIIAELLVRIDAANAHSTHDLPIAMTLGGKWNAPVTLKTVSLTVLGATADELKKHTRIICFALDPRSGQISKIIKQHSEDENTQVSSFSTIARKPYAKTNSIADLARGNLVIKGAKLSPSRQLTLGRNQMVVNPHDYNWNSLPPPVLYDDFRELSGSLETEHPNYLSDRSSGNSVRVAKIKRCLEKSFDYGEQTLGVQLEDALGNIATLKLPYRQRAAEGFERTIQALAQDEYELQFIAGIWHMAGAQLVVRPITLVFQTDGKRFAVQPDIGLTFNWPDIDKGKDITSDNLERITPKSFLPTAELLRFTGILIQKGLLRLDPIDKHTLQQLIRDCTSCGSTLLTEALRKVSQLYESPAQHSGLEIEPELLVQAFTKVLVICFLANKESSAQLRQLAN